MSDLINLIIDGIAVSVPAGTLVVDAAKKVGIEIPVFCHHPKLEPVGMCRMCLVAIGRPVFDRATGEAVLDKNGQPQINFGPGLQTGCTVPVSEGMVVITDNPQTEAARESVIEFLLTSHPLDCPICDKGGECPLQNLTMAYGKGESRMLLEDKMQLAKHVPLGELIFLDRERCIQCARCIRFQDEVVDDPVIAFHNRGRRLEIVTLSEPGFDSYWSGNTTDICPVGALTTADFRFGARPWELNPVSTISVHGPAGSNMTVSTRREAKAGGRRVIKRVLPRQNELVNEIWISDRDRFVYHFAEAADRLREPLVRKDGRLQPATWDEALDLVAAQLQQHKGSVAGLAGDRLSNEDYYLFQKLFRQGLGSHNLDLADSRLAGGDIVAQVGFVSGADASYPQRLGAGDAVLVVASDLHEEEPIWWLRAKQAADRGATVVVLNARPTRLDEYATHVLHVEPGAVVTAVRQLLTAAKVDSDSEEALTAAASALVNAQNMVIFYGYEGLTYPETELLARLLGNLLLVKNAEGFNHVGRPNNGLIPVWPHNNTQGAWDMGIHPAYFPGYQDSPTPGQDARHVYQAAHSGSLRALYVLGSDPVGDGLLPGRGGLDFLVVQELFMTATAELADVVLPAQSWVERDGTFTSGERRVQRTFPAIQPLGNTRADWQILALLNERVGLGKPPVAASQIFTELSKTVPQYKGMDYRVLARVEEQWPDVGHDDVYYGGTVYENRSGLGLQWQPSAGPDAEPFTVAEPKERKATPDLQLMRVAALYNPGTLINHSEVLRDRLAQPELRLNSAEAGKLGLLHGDRAAVTIGQRGFGVAVTVDPAIADGLALLRGVPYFAGLVPAEINKIASLEREIVV